MERDPQDHEKTADEGSGEPTPDVTPDNTTGSADEKESGTDT